MALALSNKRDTILSAAEKIFARFGIKKTTMDDIARAARIGKSTLYYYFKGKEDVYAEVIEKESKLLKSKLRDAIDEVNDPKEKLRVYFFTRMIYLKNLSNYYTTLTDEYLEHYSFVEKYRKDFYNYETQTIARILKEGINGGIFSVANLMVSARMIALALKGLEFPLVVEEKEEEMETTINLMLDILLYGITL